MNRTDGRDAMLKTKDHSKSRQIVDVLNEAIDSGALAPGARIESVRELAAKHHVSLSVVTNAYNQLERQGRIERRPRSGVYVKENADDEPLSSGVLVCMQPDGHLWADFFGQILGELNARGWTALAVRHDLALRNPPTPELSRQLEQLARSDLKGAIVMGGDYWKNPFLADFPRRRTVFVFELDYPEICGHGVLADYEAASYALAGHLLETGKRRIAFAVPPEALRPGKRRMLHFDQLCNGYERALRDYNLAGQTRYLTEFDDVDEAAAPERLARLLGEKRAPDAVMCYMDSMAAKLVRAATGLGVRVPEAFAVTGFYQTPWADWGPRPLTTVKFDTAFMARRAVELLEEAPEEPQVLYVRPQVRVGASTATATEMAVAGG